MFPTSGRRIESRLVRFIQVCDIGPVHLLRKWEKSDKIKVYVGLAGNAARASEDGVSIMRTLKACYIPNS
jgi:hypothetical protein